MNIKLRLIIMNFLEYGVWGAYLTSMGSYLATVGLGAQIGLFYAMQGIVSLFMPALLGIVADKWIPAQRLLGFSHIISALCMLGVGFYGMSAGKDVNFPIIFTLYSLAVAFYMPTIALSNSVAYTALDKAGLDTIKDFPSIRVFGTIGFIVVMWAIDLIGIQSSYAQFLVSAGLGILLGIYSQTLPSCSVSSSKEKKSLIDALGLKAFKLFKKRQMALFFIFSMFLGVSLQITNGYANPFIKSFKASVEFANTFGANHANILYSLSQISETLCILLIPFFMKRFGIKRVMLIAMLAWVARFGFFAIGNTGDGLIFLILSMIVYGVAFDFFNVSGSLYVNEKTDLSIRSSAQGLFVIMTNGVGATVGMLAAQVLVNIFIKNEKEYMVGDWSTVWAIFAAYALLVAICFAIFFKHKHIPAKK